MTPDRDRAERFQQVRDAAAGWRDAGAIDEATRAAIAAAYPDDRFRLRLWLRSVAFLAALAGGLAVFGLVAEFLPAWWEHASPVCAAAAAFFVLATELQLGRFRRAESGSEEATALLAVGFAVASVVVAFDAEVPLAWLPLATAVCVLAVWRWGQMIVAWAALILALAWLARFPHARILWVAACGIAIPFLRGAARSYRHAPSHRRCAEALLLGAVVAIYVAINILCLDRGIVESLGGRTAGPAPPWLRAGSAVLTAVVPLVVLAAGVLLRDRMGLVLGAALVAAALATLRQYHPLGPLWSTLAAGGASCIAAALIARRYLAGGPDRERAGFTAEPLFEDRRAREIAQVAGVAATLGPTVRPASHEGFRPGGGLSGGGGASGSTG
jgi:hypothetical protein